ncbi:MAG: DoxX family protein [Acidobacteriaceae bacterium]
MTAKTVGYWATTGVVAAELLAGAVLDLTRQPMAASVIAHLGYPAYLLTILGVWKLLAVPAILSPGFLRLKEWAYAGIFFEMSGAVLSHAACGDGKALIAPLIFTALGLISWWLRPANRVCGASRLEQVHA